MFGQFVMFVGWNQRVLSIVIRLVSHNPLVISCLELVGELVLVGSLPACLVACLLGCSPGPLLGWLAGRLVGRLVAAEEQSPRPGDPRSSRPTSATNERSW